MRYIRLRANHALHPTLVNHALHPTLVNVAVVHTYKHVFRVARAYWRCGARVSLGVVPLGARH